MRVGIITMYYKSYNFGGQLQSYGMYKALKNLGCDARQISFVPDNRKKYGTVRYIKIKYKMILRNLLLQIKSRRLTSINKNMKLFMNSIPHTSLIKAQKLYVLNKEYDGFVAGSDQIWNPAFAYDEYFLNFAENNKRKISYAASIGVTDCGDEEKDYLIKQIERMDYVSVREIGAKNLLNQIMPNKKVSWVLDPTFLLSKEQWSELDVSNKMDLPKHYAAVYLMGNNIDNINLVNKIINEMGIESVIIPFTVSDYNKNSKNDLGPKEFVTIIKNAEVVFTDSFHATCFSIINGVNFYCLSRNGTSKNKSMNSRIESLFDMFEIQPRWIRTYEDYENLNSEISYDEINEKIYEYQKASLYYLNNALLGKEQTEGICI